MAAMPRKLYRAGAIVVIAAFIGGFFKLSYAQQSAPPAPAIKPSSATPALHGRKLAEAYCAGCHGVDGNTTTDPLYPKLADQKVSYIRLQLRAFKSGARKSDIMSGPASAITNAQIEELARYYSDQPLKADPIKDRQLAAIGERIFRSPSRGAPACIACHGRGGPGFGRGGMMGGGRGMGGMMRGRMGMMMGNTTAVPYLYGQHAAYSVQQLDAFASGARRGTVMGPISAALRPRNRRAVAEYLSGAR